MDTLGFTLKRADQRMLAFQRALLHPLLPLGLTPARYVLLFLVSRSTWKADRDKRYVLQSQIWRNLGVSPVTVCKIMKCLERHDLVRRVHRFDPNDKRQVAVFLTQKAWGLLRTVHRAFIQPGVLWIAMETILGERKHVGAVTYMLEQLRKGLRDTATFRYPPSDREIFPERKHPTPPRHVWPATQPRAAAIASSSICSPASSGGSGGARNAGDV